MNTGGTMKITYQAICTCGYKGRIFQNPNAADEAAENHAISTDPFQGGRNNGRKHHTSVKEVK